MCQSGVWIHEVFLGLAFARVLQRHTRWLLLLLSCSGSSGRLSVDGLGLLLLLLVAGRGLLGQEHHGSNATLRRLKNR